jgi:hypothetical protein
MINANYTPDDLKKLPLRAIVALAARCARRVEQQACPRDGHPQEERCRKAVADAIALAEDFARGLPWSSLESVIHEVEACRAFVANDYERESAMGAAVFAAHAAATASLSMEMRAEPELAHYFGPLKPTPLSHLAEVTADLAARDAFLAASDAIGAQGHVDGFVQSAIDDYKKLLLLNLGRFPEAGGAVDVSSNGPLGPVAAAV